MNDQYCLYFLLQKRRIVYIGVSRVLKKRLGTHCSEKRFDSVKVFSMPDRQTALMYERRWIAKFDPLYNTLHSATKGHRFLNYKEERTRNYSILT